MKVKSIFIALISIHLWSPAQNLNKTSTNNIKKNVQQIKAAVEKMYHYDTVPKDPFHTRVYTLPNGLKVYLSPYHAQPRIFTMIAVKAGSKYDPANATGLAHYLEHMLFKGTDIYGTKNYEKEKPLLDKIENLFETYRQTKDETQRQKIYHQIDSISFIAAKYAIANEYDKMAASIGAKETNAFTSNDETVYVNDIPSNQINNWLTIEAERFRNPVFRLFHTELEAVYEEKNRSLDNDEYQMYEKLYEALFPNHPYGTQTTIGTVEHLKNPSLREIKAYFDKYYVPNNMAIIMCGDFNPDTVIKQIYAHFSSMPSKPIPPLKFYSPDLNQRIEKEVTGPKSEMMVMGWKTNGASTKDRLYLSLITNILQNSKSGLIDVDVTGKQKVLSTSVFADNMKDYGVLAISAEPKENQSLQDIEKIILEEIHKLQNGEFDDQLLKDIITNKKLELQTNLENNENRALIIFSSFTKDIPLNDVVNELEELKKINKADIMKFAQTYLRDNNYAVVFKKIGNPQTVKVTKPAITPVELDRNNTSSFANNIIKNTPKPIAPQFIDFKKDIHIIPMSFSTAAAAKTLELLYNKNNENELFEFTYYFNIDANRIKEYQVIFKYLNDFPATQSVSTEQLLKRLYQIGCNIKWYINAINNEAYITVTGLSENFKEAIAIAEAIIQSPKIEESTFNEFINDLIKERNDSKKDKNVILRNLTFYSVYGPKNIINNVLNNDELKQLTSNNAVKIIKELNAYPHQLLYYGPLKKETVISEIKKLHHIPPQALTPSTEKIYNTESLSKGKQIFYTPYEMQQAEFIITSKVSDFTPQLIPSIKLYNTYFGENMSGVVFQEIRESKALAYAAHSSISMPVNKNYPFISKSYIGTQADKLKEALSSIFHLLDTLPYNKSSFETAKEGLLQQIRTQRILKTDIFFEYLKAKKLGIDYDIRKNIFQEVQNLNFKDVLKFSQTYISNKPRNISIIGDETKINFDVLKQYGNINKISLSEIFGY